MIRNIMKGEYIFSQVSTDATKDDIQYGLDLKETLLSQQNACVGMAANMIGIYKNIIVILTRKNEALLMFNPQIVKVSGQKYECQEGCLSLTGTRVAKRYKTIKVKYYNEKFQLRIKNFTDIEAQIIQHEIDHCHGIVI